MCRPPSAPERRVDLDVRVDARLHAPEDLHDRVVAEHGRGVGLFAGQHQARGVHRDLGDVRRAQVELDGTGAGLGRDAAQPRRGDVLAPHRVIDVADAVDVADERVPEGFVAVRRHGQRDLVRLVATVGVAHLDQPDLRLAVTGADRPEQAGRHGLDRALLAGEPALTGQPVAQQGSDVCWVERPGPVRTVGHAGSLFARTSLRCSLISLPSASGGHRRHQARLLRRLVSPLSALLRERPAAPGAQGGGCAASRSRGRTA